MGDGGEVRLKLWAIEAVLDAYNLTPGLGAVDLPDLRTDIKFTYVEDVEVRESEPKTDEIGPGDGDTLWSKIFLLSMLPGNLGKKGLWV
jgi:hypothetical protein